MASQKHIAFCPHCGNTAPQSVKLSQRYQTKWYETETGELDVQGGPECESIVCICETCNQVLVYDGITRAETSTWPDLKYPKAPELDRSVPKAICDIYREAVMVKNTSARAYALLIRRAVEAICDDRRIPPGSLATRLAALAKRGDVPPVLAEVTDVLRILGNVAAHGTTIKVPMVWALDDFFRAVVEYVYVAPSKLADFKVHLQKLRTSSSGHGTKGRICDNCGQARATSGGKSCSAGHFVCASCVSGVSGTDRKNCPLCNQRLR